MHIAERGLLELVIWSGLVMTRMTARAAGFLLEWLFVVAAWIALFIIGAVMAVQRGGLSRLATGARAISRSADSTTRRTLLR